jgi:hypothetical protein
MYFPRNWEFGSALLKLRNFRGGLNPFPFGTPLERDIPSDSEAELSAFEQVREVRINPIEALGGKIVGSKHKSKNIMLRSRVLVEVIIP